jgi:hypothetical protein
VRGGAPHEQEAQAEPVDMHFSHLRRFVTPEFLMGPAVPKFT